MIKVVCVKLEGNNLCERQKNLNLKVNDAADIKVDFQAVKSIPEHCNVDRVFKIDLASKFRDIDYIVEQLKCGDSLYITRALKCEWMYSNKYAHIINPDYLHKNIFPAMSVKMKNKTLSTISIHVRDKIRAQLFYEYCTNENLTKHANKFLIFTSESLRHKFLSDEENFRNVQHEKLCLQLIGNSFYLADTYGRMGGLIRNLSHLYSINEEKYLDLLERYTTSQNYVEHAQMGAKMSRSVMKRHKNRVLNNPALYLSILKTSEVLKYSTPADAQVYLLALLPNEVQEFWKMNFYMLFKHFFDLIKTDDLKYVRKLFIDKYPLEEFDMSKEFFLFGYHEFMNSEEKETWALLHLEKQLGLIWPEYDYYRWYEFITFSKTFEHIVQTRMLVAFDWSQKSGLLKILVKSAKTNEEIAQVLDYYYEIREKKYQTQTFIEYVVEHHKVYDFDDTCWSAFDKILHGLGIYASSSKHNILLDISIIYHILTNKHFPYFDLGEYMSGTFYYCLELLPCNNRLSKLEQVAVYDYMFSFYMNKIAAFESKDYNESVKDEIRPYLKQMACLKYYFENKDDYPDLVLKFMKLDLENFKHNLGIQDGQEDFVFTEGYLIRCLKQDPSVIIEKLSLFQELFTYRGHTTHINFFRKMKIYFSDDLAKQYLDLCTKTLFSITRNVAVEKKRIISACIFVIFLLGDDRIKIDLMEKHAPKCTKIDLWDINPYIYLSREAICFFHRHSRPPVPFNKTRLYLRGDYLQMSQGILNMYLVMLTPASLATFIRLLLISPLSIQKIGLRLAFQVSKTSGKRNLVTIVWMRTEHVAVRKRLYTLIMDRMGKKSEQQETFEVLMELTSSIKNNDDDEIFRYLKGNKLPEYLRGSYLQTAWDALAALQGTNQNFERRAFVMKAIKRNMDLMDEAFIVSLIDKYLKDTWVVLKDNPLECPDVDKMDNATWNLVIEYIIDIPNDDKQEKSITIVNKIINVCFDNWHVKFGEEFTYQLFFRDFVTKLDDHAAYTGTQYSRATHVFEYLLKSFEDRFGIAEMYSYFWDWQLVLLTRKSINGKDECDKEVHICFGSELAKFIKNLKEKNCYYVSFLRKIIGKILTSMEVLYNLKTPELTDRYVKILVAYGLTIDGVFETYALALQILPDDLSSGPINEPELKEVIRKIRQQNNEELIALMNDIIIYSNQKERIAKYGRC